MQIVMSTISGRTYESSQDKFGRWAWYKMKGKMIERSQSTQHTGSVQAKLIKTQARTIAAHESQALLKINHPSALFPRKAMLDDLQVATNKEKVKGSMILILMDANTKHDAKDIQ